jgi:hypothetical protein
MKPVKIKIFLYGIIDTKKGSDAAHNNGKHLIVRQYFQ